MAIAKQSPLPGDYVRPSLAEFKEAGITHVDYETFIRGHEAELRKHHVPDIQVEPEPMGAEEIVIIDEIPTTTDDPSKPWEYVRDERGIITGTRAVAPEQKEGSATAGVQPSDPEENGPAETATGAPPAAV